ncbi:MAG: methylated-DNA--[protein]-cysteine S-methyltransferase [Bacteriovoracaceae bacterium]|nr:methylated-DNA--[protein]-cysteine S-methyltransferase [Bacteriovoracaceae bacterium]
MKPKANELSLIKLNKIFEPFPLQPTQSESLYASLTKAICSQQLSLKAAATIYSRFEALFSDGVPTVKETLLLSRETLRKAGLSEAKVTSIFDLANKAQEGVVPSDKEVQQLSDEEIIARLTQIKGIGIWTAQMVLMFRYGREDVWPVDDLGVQNGFKILFPKLKFKNKKDLLKWGEKWKGKRSHVAWFCWRVLEERKKQTITSVPLIWKNKKLKLWIKDGLLFRLDFSRSEKVPKLSWPGEFKEGKAKASFWQKKLTHGLRHGVDPQEISIKGTAFQEQVWAAIAAVPWGVTKTYLELAQDIGNEKAVRAVAQACGANPLPLFIPCHRIVGTHDIGGFSGGLALKRMLLAAEKL